AGHRFHSEPPFRRGVSDSDVHMRLDHTEIAPAVVGRAGLTHAHSNEVPPRRLSPEVSIVGQDSGDLGIRHARHLGNLRNRTRRHMAQDRLDSQKRLEDVRLGRQYWATGFERLREAGLFVNRHRATSSSPTWALSLL